MAHASSEGLSGVLDYERDMLIRDGFPGADLCEPQNVGLHAGWQRVLIDADRDEQRSARFCKTIGKCGKVSSVVIRQAEAALKMLVKHFTVQANLACYTRFSHRVPQYNRSKVL